MGRWRTGSQIGRWVAPGDGEQRPRRAVQWRPKKKEAKDSWRAVLEAAKHENH